MRKIEEIGADRREDMRIGKIGKESREREESRKERRAEKRGEQKRGDKRR